MTNQVRVGVGTTGVGKASSDLDRFRDKIDKLQKQGAKGFAIGAGAAVTAKGLDLLGGAVEGVGDAINQSLQDASNLEQSMGAVESVFGSAAGKVEAFGKRADDALGLSQNAVNEMAAVIGAQLQGMGLELDAAAEKTFELQQRAADMAATFGGTTRDAIQAITALMRGERDPIERYGVSIKAADVEARILAKGLDTTTTAARKNSEAVAGMELLMEQTAKTMGQFAREADSAAGSSQRLNARLENMSAEFGEKILPLQVAALETLIFALDRTAVPLDRLKEAAERGSQGAAAQFRFLEHEAERLGITIEEAWERANAGTLKGAAAMSDLGNFAGKAKDDVAGAADGMSDSVKGFGQQTSSTRRTVVKNLGDIADAFDDTWAELSGAADQAAEDIFGPLKREAELKTLKADLKEVAELLNNPGTPGPELADARAQYVGLREELFKLKAEMAGKGELSADSLVDFQNELREALKTATVEQGVSILVLLGQIDKLIAKAKTFRLGTGGATVRPVGLPSGPQERAHGGPVRKGVPYVVGEHHSEVFIPDQDGTIDPRAPTPVTGGAGAAYVAPSDGGALLAEAKLTNQLLARVVAREPAAARPQTARGQLAREASMMPGGRL